MKNVNNRCFGYSIIDSRVPMNKTRDRNRRADYNQYFKTMGVDNVHNRVEQQQVMPSKSEEKHFDLQFLRSSWQSTLHFVHLRQTLQPERRLAQLAGPLPTLQQRRAMS